ncbi:MAG: SdrD B-like domain-containing protein [Chloroflexota bacterium]
MICALLVSAGEIIYTGGIGFASISAASSVANGSTAPSTEINASTINIGNYVWRDRNRNGIQDEEPTDGINGIVVRLFNEGDDPTAVPPVATTVTTDNNAGESGYFLFTGLGAGSYFVQFDLSTLPSGYLVSPPHSGSNDLLDSDADQTTGITPATGVMTVEEQDLSFSMGIYRLPDLTLSTTDGGASTFPGGVILYTLAYDNTGDFNATGVVISNVVPDHTIFDNENSATGWSCEDGDAAGTACTISIGTVTQSGSVIFAVRVNNPLTVGVSQIENTAFISADGPVVETILNNNLDSDETPIGGLGAPLDPTAIELVSFVAVPTNDAIRVRWETNSEVDTFGFHLYRSTSEQLAEAVRVNMQMVPAQGESGGIYTYLDESALANVAYAYWLVEIENGVEAQAYGPVRATLQVASVGYWVYLPAVAR